MGTPSTEQVVAPAGWEVVAVSEEYTPGHRMVLTRRLSGGWMLVGHRRGCGIALEQGRETVADLLAVTDQIVESFKDKPSVHPTLVFGARWLRSVVCSFYDPADPVEAAEAVLVAMGGPVSLIPRALTEVHLSPRTGTLPV